MSNYFVTGVSKGLGFALCKQLLESGNQVVGVARTELSGKQLDLLRTEKMFFYQCDISKKIDVEKIIKKLDVENFIPDCVILNAGIHHEDQVSGLCENYEAIFQINCLGALIWVQHFLPKFEKRNSGTFVFISSLSAVFPFPGRGSYSASKSYVSTSFKCFQRSYATKKVNFCNVFVGLLDTDMSSQVRIPNFFKYPADLAAKKIIKTVMNKKRNTYFPIRNVILEICLYLIPDALLLRILGKVPP